MSIKIIPPSVVQAGRADWNTRTNLVTPLGVNYVAQTAIFRPGTDAGGVRTLTLPDATTFGVGKPFFVADESASIRPWYSIGLAPVTGQKLNGVVNEIKELVWPREGIEIVCTGDGWWTRGSNITPTVWQEIQRNAGREQVCMENDFSCITQYNSAPPEIRSFGSNHTITNISPTNAHRSIYSLMTTPTGWHRLSSELGGNTNATRKKHWAEFTISGFDLVPPANNLSYVDWALQDTLTSGGATQNGVIFRFLRAGGRTNWTLISVNNGVETALLSSIPLTITTFTRFTLGVELNDTLTAAHYFVNGVFAGTIATNIPNGSISLAVAQSILGNNGSGANVQLDRWRHSYDVVVTGNRN
jgi:hypothetical protein